MADLKPSLVSTLGAPPKVERQADDGDDAVIELVAEEMMQAAEAKDRKRLVDALKAFKEF